MTEQADRFDRLEEQLTKLIDEPNNIIQSVALTTFAIATCERLLQEYMDNYIKEINHND